MKEDTYFHWAKLELDDALAAVGSIADGDLLNKWREATRVAELGLRVCGPRKGLCQLAGMRVRERRRRWKRLNEFAQADFAWGEAVGHFRRGLAATASREREVSRDQLYRGLSIAMEGLGDMDALAELRADWSSVTPSTVTRLVGVAAPAGDLADPNLAS